MKRFKEIKELLSNVYFDNDEVSFVVAFLDNIGLKNSSSIVISEDEYNGYLESGAEKGTTSELELMPAIDFLQECTGREIDGHYSLSTVLVMAIDDYISQLKELKEMQDKNNDQAQKNRDKEILLGFAIVACSSEDSLMDVFEELKRQDEKVALSVLEVMSYIVK